MELTKSFIDARETQTILEKFVTVSITTKVRNPFVRWFKKKKWIKYDFKVYPLKGAQQFRIINRLASIDESPFNSNDSVMSVYNKMMVSHFKDIVYCVGVLLSDPRNEPSEWLLDLIENDMNNEHYQEVWNIAFEQMNVYPFLNGIVLMKGIKVEANPINQMRDIASGKSSEV